MPKIILNLVFVVLLFACCLGSHSFALSANDALVSLGSVDPAGPSTLGNEDKLYLLVRYESEAPLRFQAVGLHNGMPLEVGSIRNPAGLHAPGAGEALVWVGYTNPTHIDAVRVVVMDEGWSSVYTLTQEVDVKWQGLSSAETRSPAKWVDSMIRAEERKLDYFYDPSPNRYSTLYDVVFFLTMVSIPAYILLQLHMLWRYRYRWRELAMIPIFPYLILAFYMIVGLEIDESLRITFLFRYTPLALLYLVGLWLAKRFWQDKLPPPKLYKQPKS